MSTDNKRKVLVGFGAFAVGLIAILAIWRPPAFRSEDASGSIGTVQKYHAPQITPQDVVLGNETTRRAQQIRYADFLNDAAKLHALSAKITASNFEAASAEMDAMRGEVRHRYFAAAKEAVAAAQALARSNKDQAFARSNKDQAFARENKDQAFARENKDQAFARENKNQAFARENKNQAFARENKDQTFARENKDQTFARSNREQALARSSKETESGISELSAILESGQLSDAEMANFNIKLASIAGQLGGKTAADRAQTASHEVAAAVAEMRTNQANAAAKMESAAGELQALYGVSLADEVQYLSVTEMESKAIDRAQAELKMMNASTSLAAAYHKNMGGVSAARELLAQADVLESRAAKAMENQLGLLVVIASAFREIDANLTAARGNAAVANEASAAARGQAYDKAFANLNQAFAGTKAQFNASANAGIHTELAALDSYLASASQAGVKAANMREMENVLAMLSEKLAGSSALAASLAGRQQLAAQAHQLSERAAAARN